jgi:hypothetical protein
MKWFFIIWPAIICVAALILFTVAVHNEQNWHAVWMAALALGAGMLSVRGFTE